MQALLNGATPVWTARVKPTFFPTFFKWLEDGRTTSPILPDDVWNTVVNHNTSLETRLEQVFESVADGRAAVAARLAGNCRALIATAAAARAACHWSDGQAVNGPQQFAEWSNLASASLGAGQNASLFNGAQLQEKQASRRVNLSTPITEH